MNVLARSGAAVAGEDEVRAAWVPAARQRRLDPVTRLACRAVGPLVVAGWQPDPGTAVVFATAFGSLVSTLRFADSLRGYGDGGGSPSPFTTSVHNATGGALAELLGLKGPGFTVSHGVTSGLAALALADDLLAEERCPAALVVTADLVPDWLLPAVAACAPGGARPGGCAAALLLLPGGQGRPLLATPAPDAPVLALADGAAGSVRSAADAVAVLGCWCPTGLLAALVRRDPAGPITLVEAAGDEHRCQGLGAWTGG